MTINSYNTTLYYGTALSSMSSLTPIIEVNTPKVVYKEIETTALTDLAETFIAGIVKNDKVGFTILHSSANKTLLEGLLGASKFWKILFSDATGYSWVGFLMSMEAQMKVNSVIEWKCEICVSGAITTI